MGELGLQGRRHLASQPGEGTAGDKGTCSVFGQTGHQFWRVDGRQPKCLCWFCEHTSMRNKLVLWTSGSVNLILISVKKYKPRLTLRYTQISLWTFCTAVQSFLLFQRTISFGINNLLLQRVCSYGYQDSLYFHNWNRTWLLQHPQREWDFDFLFCFPTTLLSLSGQSK